PKYIEFDSEAATCVHHNRFARVARELALRRCASVFVPLRPFFLWGRFDRWLDTFEMPVKKAEPAPHRVMNHRLLPQPFHDSGGHVELAVADAQEVLRADPQDVSRQRFLEHVPVVVDLALMGNLVQPAEAADGETMPPADDVVFAAMDEKSGWKVSHVRPELVGDAAEITRD